MDQAEFLDQLPGPVPTAVVDEPDAAVGGNLARACEAVEQLQQA